MLLILRVGEQGEGDLPDALAVDGFDGEGIAAEADLLSAFGEGAGEFQQESGQGVGFAFGGFEGLLLAVVEVHGAVEVLERDVAFEEEVGGVFLRIGRFFLVEFVRDVAHDLFEDVVHGEDARGAAVFVHHDGHVVFLLLEVHQDVVDLAVLGNEQRSAQERLPGEVRLAQVPQQVLDVEDADDVVRVLVVNGDAGVALFDDLAFQTVEGAGVRQGEHFGAGGHHGAGFGLAEGYDAFQDALFPVFVQFAAGGHFECLGEVVHREGFVRTAGEDLFQPPAQQHERSAEDAHQAYHDGHRSGGKPAEAFVVAGGVHLGQHFAEEYQQEGGEHDRNDYAQHRMFDDQIIAQQVFEDQDDADVDEIVDDQDGGQQPFGFFQQARHIFLARVARGAEGLDLGLGEGKQRSFRTRHQGRNHEQQDEQKDVGDRVKIDVFSKQQQRTTIRVGVQNDRF